MEVCGWNHSIWWWSSTVKHMIFFPSLKTGQIGLLKGEAVGVVMPSLSRSRMKNFNPWRSCVSFTLSCINYFNWVGGGPWSPILSSLLLSQTRSQVCHRAPARHKLYLKAPDIGIWTINNSSCLQGKVDTLGWEEMPVPRRDDWTWSSVGTSWPVINGSIPGGLHCCVKS